MYEFNILGNPTVWVVLVKSVWTNQNAAYRLRKVLRFSICFMPLYSLQNSENVELALSSIATNPAEHT